MPAGAAGASTSAAAGADTEMADAEPAPAASGLGPEVEQFTGQPTGEQGTVGATQTLLFICPPSPRGTGNGRFGYGPRHNTLGLQTGHRGTSSPSPIRVVVLPVQRQQWR